MAGIREVLEVFEAAGGQLGAEQVADSVEDTFSEASRVIRILWSRSLLDAGGLRGLELRRSIDRDRGETMRDLTWGITELGRAKLRFWRARD